MTYRHPQPKWGGDLYDDFEPSPELPGGPTLYFPLRKGRLKVDPAPGRATLYFPLRKGCLKVDQPPGEQLCTFLCARVALKFDQPPGEQLCTFVCAGVASDSAPLSRGRDVQFFLRTTWAKVDAPLGGELRAKKFGPAEEKVSSRGRKRSVFSAHNLGKSRHRL
jgi:hypothetical protein